MIIEIIRLIGAIFFIGAIFYVIYTHKNRIEELIDRYHSLKEEIENIKKDK